MSQANGLPPAWTTVAIEELLAPLQDGLKIHQGWSPQCESVPAGPTDWGVLKTTAIQAGRFEAEHNKKLPDALEPRPKIEVQAGDLLLTCAGPRSRCGVPTLVHAAPKRLMLSGKMYRFRGDERLILDRYLEFFLLSPQGQAQIEGMKTGISDSGLNLTQGRFFKLAVPFPPLKEQARIVAEVSRRLSHVDAATRALVGAGARLDAARRSVIHQTITDGYSPAPGAASDSHRDRDEVPTVPSHWRWEPLGNLLAEPLRNGRSARTTAAGNGVRTYTITAVTQRDFGMHNTKWAEGDLEATKELRVRDGDVFVQRSNTAELVGSAALYRGPDTGTIFPDLLIRVRPAPEVLPEWVELVMRWTHTRRFLRSVASGLAGSMPKIDQGKLSRVAVPVPPREEQANLVAEADRRLSLLDTAGTDIARAERRAHRTRRGILRAAFDGQLVSGSIDDEPAEQLLERIRSTKTAPTPKKRTRRAAKESSR